MKKEMRENYELCDIYDTINNKNRLLYVPIDILDHWTSNKNYIFRCAAALSPNNSEKNLLKLSHDRSYKVRLCCALNYKLPYTRLKELLNDKHFEVREFTRNIFKKFEIIKI